jgi:hypothetical protein
MMLAGCAGDGARLSMSFQRATLYDAPFPSDDLKKADGTIDVSKIPNPNNVDLINQALALLATDAHGFAVAGGVFFRAGGPLDVKTLPDVQSSVTDQSSVFIIGVDSTQPDYLKKRPVNAGFLADGGPFGDKNLLGLVPLQGVPLRAHERYAAVVTSRVHDAQGRPLARAPELSQIAGGHAPAGLGDDVFAEYRDAYALVKNSDPVAMAVFTTDDPTAQMALVRDDALANHPLTSPSPSPSPSDTFDDYCVFTGGFDLPEYQSGTAPYQQTGGDWKFDAAGKPLFDHTESSRVVFTIPRAPTPAGGWPVVLFVRTGAGGDRPLVDRGQSAGAGFDGPIVPGSGPALYFAKAGFAGVQFDGVLGGIRNPAMDASTEDLAIFNVFNASALRDNIRQSALELILFARLLPAIKFDASNCPGADQVSFDPTHLALMGHSMGAWIAPVALAYEPSLRAAVLSGAGGSYIANVMDKTKPLDVRPLMEIILDYNMDERSLDWHDPVLTLIQWAAEPSDPQAYDSLVAPRHVLMEQGIVDHYILPSIANSTSLALGLDLAGPAYDASNPEEQMLMQPALAPLLPLAGRSAIPLPASGNAGGSTMVVIQHPGDGIEDGHEVVFQTDAPKHQYRCFLQSFAKGVPSVPPDDAADAPCP